MSPARFTCSLDAYQLPMLHRHGYVCRRVVFGRWGDLRRALPKRAQPAPAITGFDRDVLVITRPEMDENQRPTTGAKDTQRLIDELLRIVRVVEDVQQEHGVGTGIRDDGDIRVDVPVCHPPISERVHGSSKMATHDVHHGQWARSNLYGISSVPHLLPEERVVPSPVQGIHPLPGRLVLELIAPPLQLGGLHLGEARTPFEQRRRRLRVQAHVFATKASCCAPSDLPGTYMTDRPLPGAPSSESIPCSTPRSFTVTGTTARWWRMIEGSHQMVNPPWRARSQNSQSSER